MQKEIWKDIPSYEGLYQVSNLGNVKSLPKKWVAGKGRILSHNGKILAPQLSGPLNSKYYQVGLRKNNTNKYYRIHLLVALTFLNFKTDKYKVIVDHINNDKLDNRLENLQIVSHRINSSKDRINKTSKYTGVYWNKKRKKWGSSIRINNNKIYLGFYENEIDAYNSYLFKLKEVDIMSYNYLVAQPYKVISTIDELNLLENS